MNPSSFIPTRSHHLWRLALRQFNLFLTHLSHPHPTCQRCPSPFPLLPHPPPTLCPLPRTHPQLLQFSPFLHLLLTRPCTFINAAPRSLPPLPPILLSYPNLAVDATFAPTPDSPTLTYPWLLSTLTLQPFLPQLVTLAGV
jgi:hypothetical protein